VFAGAIASQHGAPGPGTTVELHSAKGEFLARAAFSPASQIRARVWTFDVAEAIGEEFFGRRIEAALARRAPLGSSSSALRLVHGEADGLPGMIVDRYADWLVVQFLSAGVEAWREALLSQLLLQTGCAHAYERSDAEVRALEGLALRDGPLAGAAPTAAIEISENGLRYGVDPVLGQKTGFFIDQRDNRARVRAQARGEVLNCFCYTGGFTLAALAGGAAHVVSIDSSEHALEQARANLALNALDAQRCQWLCADAFTALRELRNQGRQFDVVILDPPKFAPTAAHVERAARAYKDINLLGLKLLRPGGTLFTFSCSGGVSADLFQKIVAGAAADAGVYVTLEARLSAAADHPVALSFPEGDYLKGLELRKSALAQPAFEHAARHSRSRRQ
jgi:23S rRNA (cytosine1962-C5)-methyltransferase